MHELSIACSLVEAVQEEMERLKVGRVEAIHLKMGRLSGVVREALESSFEIACMSTPLEGTRLVVEEVPVLIDCLPCGQSREIVSLQHFRCVVCGAPGGEVVQGRELQVAALEIAGADGEQA